MFRSTNRVIALLTVPTLVALPTLLAGCVSFAPRDAFDYRFADNQAEVTRGIHSRTSSVAPDQSNALGVPITVGVTESDPRAVAAFNLASGEALWSTPMEALTRPIILGDVVVLSIRAGGEHVVALDLRNGSELWRAPTEQTTFVGASRAGNTIVYVASVGAAGGATRLGTIRAVNARSGSTDWEHDIEGVLGAPSAVGSYVFVPWEKQNIVILDLNTGIEQARLRSTDDVIAWVDHTPAGLFYGGRGIYRFDERSFSGTKAGSTYLAAPIPSAPGEPFVHEDGFMPKPGIRSARGRIRIYFAPAASSTNEIAVAGDHFYYVYYRYVFAFDTEQNLSWVQMLDETIAGAEVHDDGLLTVGEEGAVRFLAASTGNVTLESNLDASFGSVSLSAHSLSGSGDAGEARDLRSSLNEMAGDSDNTLVPARAFAIELLAQIEDPEVTRDLLDLYAQRSMPGALREAIGTALRGRAIGAEHLVAALDQRYDFIEDTKAPPLGLIIPSLIENGDATAAPGLVRQMMDHETPADVLPLVVRGVVELGGEETAGALREFLRLYHADSTFRENPEALAVASEGLFRYGGPDGRELLTSLIASPRTHDPLREQMQGLFDREVANAAAAEEAETEQATLAAQQAAAEEAAARPIRLSQDQINETFTEHAGELRECVLAELARNENLSQVRIVFILDQNGRGREWRFAPDSEPFVACLRPKVTAIQFPQFRQRRQRANFTISISSGATQTEETEEPTGPQPWWVRMRARNLVTSAGGLPPLPWWVARAAPVAQQPAGGGQQPAGGGQQPAGGGQQPAGGGQQPDAGTPSEPETPWWIPEE